MLKLRRTPVFIAIVLGFAAIAAAGYLHQELGLDRVVRFAAGKANKIIEQVVLRINAPAQEQPERVGGIERFQRVESITAEDAGKGPRASLSIGIHGSIDLKLVFLARASGGVTRAPVNMYDVEAGDNTTPRAPAWVDETWRPILYRVDRFRYNSSRDRTVNSSARYSGLLFHGPPTPGNTGVLQVRNLVLYRGDDSHPPTQPKELIATPGPEGVALSWQPASDNVGVAFYSVSRASTKGDFIKIAETIDPSYLDLPDSSSEYRYRVLAVDFEDNLSLWSEAAPARFSSSFPAPVPTVYQRDRKHYAVNVRAVHAAGMGKVVKGRVLLFGDSLTAALKYRLETEGALGRYMLEARGRPRWETHQGRRIISEDLLTLNPEFCLILYGTNNSKDSAAIQRAMDDMLAMARACERNGTVPLVATIPPRGFVDPTSAPEARYNAALIETMQANRIPVAYLFREFQAEPDRKRLLYRDGIHWHSEGFVVAARAWQKAMAQVRFAILDRSD